MSQLCKLTESDIKANRPLLMLQCNYKGQEYNLISEIEYWGHK